MRQPPQRICGIRHLLRTLCCEHGPFGDLHCLRQPLGTLWDRRAFERWFKNPRRVRRHQRGILQTGNQSLTLSNWPCCSGFVNRGVKRLQCDSWGMTWLWEISCDMARLWINNSDWMKFWYHCHVMAAVSGTPLWADSIVVAITGEWTAVSTITGVLNCSRLSSAATGTCWYVLYYV